jgi:PAS domain S-box-containing protein
MEESREESVGNELPSRVLEQLPVAVLVVDREGRPCLLNEQATEVLGRGILLEGGTIAERYALVRRGADVYPDDELPVQKALRTGRPIAATDVEVVQPDGTVVPLEVVADAVVDGDGNVVNAVAAFWDVRKRRAADHERALVAAIVESTSLAVISVDRDRVVTSWNAGAATTYGCAAEEALGRNLGTLFPSVEPKAEAAFVRAAGGEQVDDVQTSRTRRDGSLVVVLESFSPIVDAEGAVVGVAVVARDVTDKQRVEDALARTQIELERNVARLERSNSELEQFAYVASHDLSEPLRAVAGMVQLLGRRYKGRLDSDADEFIDFAIDGCTRMKAMIDDVLAYSRAGRVEGTAVTVDLAGVVQDVVASLAPLIAEAAAQVTIDALPEVQGRRDAFAPLFQNLISNAVKVRRPGVAPVVAVGAARDANGWRIWVTDNGIGIEEQYEARIFRMFQRLHGRDAYPGTGIGLAIAERLVHGFGGRLWVERPPNGGSRFCFTVPDPAERG